MGHGIDFLVERDISMENDRFKKKLEEVCGLIFDYGILQLRLNVGESFEMLLGRVGGPAIVAKDFEGFKLAQKKILDAILEIEDEIISLRGRTGDSPLDKEEELNLILQVAAFKEVANSIVWIILAGNRGYIRRLISPDSGHGYLKDRNLQSELHVAEEINQKSNHFALLADITSVVGIGDIVDFAIDGSFGLVEVKEGRVAEIIFSPELHDYDAFLADIESITGDDPKKIKSFEKQIERIARQVERMDMAAEIINNDEGVDLITKVPLRIFQPSVETRSLNGIVRDVLKESDNAVLCAPSPLLIAGDACLIGITGFNASLRVKVMNFQHFFYHDESVPWDECDYIAGGSDKGRVDLKEPMAYFLDFNFYDLRNSVMTPTHTPLFLVIGVVGALKLLSNEISVFVRFYPEKFIEKCKELGCDAQWVGDSVLSKYLSGGIKRDMVANFSGKYIELSCEYDGAPCKILLSQSNLCSMIYDLEASESIIKKLISTMKFMQKGRSGSV